MFVRKRDGSLEEFDDGKILESIKKASLAVEGKDDDIQERAKQILNIKKKLIESGFSPEEAEEQAEDAFEGYIENGEYTEYDEDEANEVLDMVTDSLDNLEEEIIDSKIIQDFVEKALMVTEHTKTAKEYIVHSANRERIREMNTSLMRSFEDLTFGKSEDVETKRENANIDGDSAMGTMLKYGSEGAKKFNLLYVVSPEESRAHSNGDIHIHDLDFLTLTETCVEGKAFLDITNKDATKVEILRANELDRYFSENETGFKDVSNKDWYVNSLTGRTKVLKIARHNSEGKILYNFISDGNELDDCILSVTGEHLVPIINRKLLTREVEGYDYKWPCIDEITEKDLEFVRAKEITTLDFFILAYDNSDDSDEFKEDETLEESILRYAALSSDKKTLEYTHVDSIETEEVKDWPFVYDLETESHLYNIDGYKVVHNCCQIDLEKLFEGGFNTGHGFLREPGEIRSYAALACIAIQSNQNDQHGGQSVPSFDHYMAPGVAKSYAKNIYKILDIRYPEYDKSNDGTLLNNEGVKLILKKYQKKHRLIMNESGYEFIRDVLKNKYIGHLDDISIDYIISKARKITDNDTHQAMEAVVHNLNSMHSRAGAQVPFSSLNFGTDTSEEGRMASFNLLKATDEGLGNGETPIFPISIFKEKAGVSYNPGDPNYDLWEEACRVSAKRLFPNFDNLDAPYNLQYYKPGDRDTEVAYMGCRTRVVANVYDPNYEKVTGRGNLSFTSINLPRLGIKANGNIDKFFEMLDEMAELVHHQLYNRYLVQCRKHPRNYPFLMGQGVWHGSENLGPDDDISEILKNGSLTTGFIGLAECLKALIGVHHGESAEAQELGLRIVKFLRDKADGWAKAEKLNYTVIATPAEGLSGRFVRIDRKRYGTIPGVTDRAYYTNSFHVPVYYKITAFKKIDIEAPYHALCNGGHISYIELDGDPTKNLAAFKKIVRYMHDKGIGYGAINHPADYDPVCGYTGIINDICPRCGRREGEPMTEEVWQRIKGYPSTANARFCGYCGDIFEESDRTPIDLE